MVGARILLLVHDGAARAAAAQALEAAGFRAECTADDGDGLARAATAPPEAILMDTGMAAMGGQPLCRRLRTLPATARTPLVVLGDRRQEADVAQCLTCLADDFLVKPLAPGVLVARVRALLRRGQAAPPPELPSAVPVLDLDADRHEARVRGRRIRLSPMEFRTLSILHAHPGRILSRERIVDAVHGQGAAVTDRCVDAQISALRRKLGTDGRLIETVRGAGYRFREA